tara:strand:- start:365 stop:583 length:219 start_codon:yes stop_codon:yes gene_type:complete
MKTIIKKVIEENESASSFIHRLSDDKALGLVSGGDWLYTSKQQWKVKVRDVNKKEETIPKSKNKKKGNKKSE